MKKSLPLLITALLAIFLTTGANAQSIVSIAGVGTEGWTGDKGSPLSAALDWPTSVAIDSLGSIYIADANNNIIRKISNGIITTFAGNGFRAGSGYGGYGGDGGPATNARLSFPSGVAVDRIGQVYIADQGNHCIRKVDTAGVITTFAGQPGISGYAGDMGTPTTALLNAPTRVALDTLGNVYVADAGNSAIRLIYTYGPMIGFIYTIAGTGVTGYGGDGGPAVAAQLNMARDVAVDRLGNVYIADTYNNLIRMVDGLGTITSVAGTGISGFSGDGGPATAAYLFQPSGIAVDTSYNVYFSDLGNSRVRKFNVLGNINTIAGNDTASYNGDNRPATSAELWYPEGLFARNNKNIYIADRGNFRVRLITYTLGVDNEKNADASIKLFPNPNQGAFTISVNTSVKEHAQITICDVAGEKIREISADTNTPVDIKFDEPPGIYFLSATTANGVVNEKLMVQ